MIWGDLRLLGKTFRGNLGLLGAHFRHLVVSWVQLGVTWSTFRASLGPFGAHLCHLEVTWGHVGLPVDVENQLDVQNWWLGGAEN